MPDLPTLELTGAGVGAIVSLLLFILSEYVPGFSRWWSSLASDVKRAAIAGAGLLTTIALVVLHYAGAADLGLGPALDWGAFGVALRAWLMFAGAAQSVYTLGAPFAGVHHG